jgi:transposase
MRPIGSAKTLEARRRLAIRLLEQGLRKTEVARRVGTTRTSVTRWWKAHRRGGLQALKAQPPPHRPCQLTVRDKKRLTARLLKGARANGFATDLWTCPRIATLIQRLFAVTYHVDSMPRFLAALDFTCQRPEKRAMERDDDAVAGWIAGEWPRIKKTPPGAAPTSSSPTKRGSR